MTKTMLILFALITMMLISCANPAAYLPPEGTAIDDPELIGLWDRSVFTWEFSEDGTFTYYETGVIVYYGLYIASPETGELYLEDFESGDYGIYLYEISYNIFGNHDFVLEMIPTWVSGANPTYWIMVR